MASAYTTIACIAIVLVFQPLTATSDLLSPLRSPFSDDVCKPVHCGKGTCKASNNSTFGYMCECDPGWKQAHNNDDLMFLPCTIPNCSVNFSCSDAPAPVQDKDSNDNRSIFDPCYWVNCGGGSCNKKSPFTHTCDCQEGYYNLLNVSDLPCMKTCSLGADCERLGITITNTSTPSSSPSVSDDSTNQAMLAPIGDSNWLIIAMMSLAAVLLG